jgi:hypothetical protein
MQKLEHCTPALLAGLDVTCKCVCGVCTSLLDCSSCLISSNAFADLQVGVLTLPRLQPCLTVLPATTQTMPRAAASLGSSGGTIDSAPAAGNASQAGLRSRLGQSAAQQQTSPAQPAGPLGVPPPGQSAKLGLQGSCLLSASQHTPKLQASVVAVVMPWTD